MSNGLFIPAAGMLAEDARADAIANNLANARTAGFRKDFVSFRQRLASAGAKRLPFQDVPGLVLDSTAWDHRPGPAAVTGRPLDLALQGDGWFSVRRDGKTYYTRAGNFQVNPAGKLATADGKAEVLATGGGTISLDGVGRFEVNPNGEVVTPGGVVATIAVTTFDDESRLRKVGDVLMEDAGGAGPKAHPAPGIEAGALEQASVDPVREMTAMIQASRAYEMNAEVLRMTDEMLGRAATDVGRLRA